MKRFLTVLITSVSAFFMFTANAGAKEVYSINSSWKFFTYNERDSLNVNLPHTWNADALSGNKGYYRGIGNYLKYIEIKPQWRGKRIFVKFYGSNSVTNLMINGRHVGQHQGGSNAFTFEVTDYVDFVGRNLFWVAVNNGERIDVLPTAGDGNAYGGIFRDAELIVTDTNTLGMDRNGSDGVLVRATKVSDARAEGTVGVRVNAGAGRQIRLDLRITDAGNRVVSENTIRPRVDKGVSDHSISFNIDSPVLWDGVNNPYLYKVSVKLTDGQSIDSAVTYTGMRYFEADPRTGFTLNGKPYPLKGVILHRDRATYGPVALESHLRQDVAIIREMGANAVRVAGGAHSQEFYDLCDRYGLVVVNDLPFTGAATLERKGFYDTPEFRANAKLQLQEMIYQLGNHPSIIAWSLFSEPELRGDNPIPFIKELNSIAKALDPTRLTTGTSTKDGEINKTTDMVIFHHEFGWREGRPDDIRIWAGQLHSDPVWNRTRSAVSYRCGGSIHHQQENLRRARRTSSWHPENWQTHFHEVYLGNLGNDKAFWGIFVGDMFEYGSVRNPFGEGLGVDDGGLVTFDRQVKKDAFYLYKANWNREEPFVYITAKRNNVRSNTSQTVKVYSNQGEVELFVNGRSAGRKTGRQGVFTWENVRMSEGANSLEAVSSEYSDSATVRISPNELLKR